MGRNERIKEAIAHAAAELLFAEEVRSYRDAVHQAVRRFGSTASGSRGPHLPEYAEIHAELRRLLDFYGGETQAARVRKWRQLALKYLDLFEPFQPLLVGSVARGEVRGISDINLQLFCDKPEEVNYFLERQAVPFSEEGDAENVRLYLEEQEIEIECAVYPELARRQKPHCRITGKAQERLDARQLRALLADTAGSDSLAEDV
jgi:hypothetical protein